MLEDWVGDFALVLFRHRRHDTQRNQTEWTLIGHHGPTMVAGKIVYLRAVKDDLQGIGRIQCANKYSIVTSAVTIEFVECANASVRNPYQMLQGLCYAVPERNH